MFSRFYITRLGIFGSMIDETQNIIEKPSLILHSVGGFFNEMDQISLFHKLNSHEVWPYYKGSAILLHCFEKNKRYE
ncbi:MAG: hypothetical protein NTX65_14140 [Ignavibacteriales bacterium]|nr:hypothetical protein [Ignavibacteriales bacterium]